MHPLFRPAAGALLAATLTTATNLGAATSTVMVPIVCSRGPSGQSFHAVVTMPATQPVGSRFTVRIDSVPSAKLSHTGLNYIFDMATDYVVPTGTTYVDGSARVVPNTGTSNVRPGARAWHDAAGIHTLLPAHVDNGSGYTPPSVEFELEVTAAAGTALALQLGQVRVAANVFLLGDLRTTCTPTAAPRNTIGTTLTVVREPR